MHVHSEQSDAGWSSDPCDCLPCRAGRACVDPMDYVSGLSHAAEASIEAMMPKPEAQPVDARTGKPKDVRERDRKCACWWLMRGGEWRIEKTCAKHGREWEKDASRRASRERERNERGW